jgi:hypothetical protein
MNYKHLLFIISLLSFIKSSSQVEFKPGYFIKNNNEKINCLIKDDDTEKNPIKFEYKMENSEEVKTENIYGTKEFGIENTAKFIRYAGKVEESDDNYENASHDKNPILIDKTIFLKVYVEGTASLYYYKEKTPKYFFSVNGSEISPLINNLYLPLDYSDHNFTYNEQYKQQLLTGLSNESITQKEIENTQYKKDQLINLFEKYNTSKNSISTNYENKKDATRKKLNLSLKIGVSSSLMNFTNSYYNDDNLKFDRKTSLYAGVEVEAFFPILNNKLSILLEPNYWSFNSTNESKYTTNVKYINIPLGLRYYFVINKKSNLFINGLYGFNIAISPKEDGLKTTFYKILDRADITRNYMGGIGYSYKNKYSLETRFSTGGNIADNYLNWNSNYSVFSLILGYNFL